MKTEVIKLIIYVFNFFISLMALDSININSIFKKNKIMQARLFYLILAICMSYMISNFIFGFIFIY